MVYQKCVSWRTCQGTEQNLSNQDDGRGQRKITVSSDVTQVSKTQVYSSVIDILRNWAQGKFHFCLYMMTSIETLGEEQNCPQLKGATLAHTQCIHIHASGALCSAFVHIVLQLSIWSPITFLLPHDSPALTHKLHSHPAWPETFSRYSAIFIAVCMFFLTIEHVQNGAIIFIGFLLFSSYPFEINILSVVSLIPLYP